MDHITKIQSRNTKPSPLKANHIQTTVAIAMCALLSACGGDDDTPPTPPPSPKTYSPINNTTGKRIHYGKNQAYKTGEQIRILFQNQTDKDFEAGKLGIVSKPGDTTWVPQPKGTKDIDQTINPADIFPEGQDITTGEVLIKSNNKITTKKSMDTFHLNQSGKTTQTQGTLLAE